MTAGELTALYTQKAMTPAEVTASILDWLHASGDPCNAVVTIAAEQAIEQADSLTRQLQQGECQPGPMFGIPLTVKDISATKGILTTRGAWAKRDWVPDFDAAAVGRLRAAGAIVIGKTNTPDGAWKAESGNPLFGPTINPWDPAVTAGGSSGGAAAAVACGFGPIATGTDGFGSVRVPASYCGVVGFKGSFGLVPYYPRSAEQLSHFGPIARTVGDLAAAMSVIAGRDPRDPLSWGNRGYDYRQNIAAVGTERRIGVVREVDGFPVDPSTSAALDDFVEFLSCQGYSVSELRLPRGGGRILQVLLGAFTAADYTAYTPEQIAELDPGLQRLLQWANTLDRDDLVTAQADRLTYCTDIERICAAVDFVVSPTVATQPFAPGAVAPAWQEDDISRWYEWCSFTYPWNLAGYPALSIPWSSDNLGRPIGMQIVGQFAQDRQVLGFGHELEQRRPWKNPVAHFAASIDQH